MPLSLYLLELLRPRLSSKKKFVALAVSVLLSVITLQPVAAAEVWQVRQNHGCFGPLVEYLSNDRFKIEFEKTNLVIVADCKSGKAALWNKKKALIFRGPITSIALPMSFLARATSDLNSSEKAWRRSADEVLNTWTCSTYTSRARYQVRKGKGWISTGRRAATVVGKIWCKSEFGLSQDVTKQLCRILLFPSFGMPIQITNKYGGQKASMSLATTELKRVKEPLHCFDEPKSYKVTSNINDTMAQDESSFAEFLGD